MFDIGQRVRLGSRKMGFWQWSLWRHRFWKDQARWGMLVWVLTTAGLVGCDLPPPYPSYTTPEPSATNSPENSPTTDTSATTSAATSGDPSNTAPISNLDPSLNPNNPLRSPNPTMPAANQPQVGQLTADDPESAINLRSQPTVNSEQVSYGIVGDRVQVLRTAQGDDGYPWYYVQFTEYEAEGWVRGDFVQLETAPRPSSSTGENPPSPSEISPSTATAITNPDGIPAQVPGTELGISVRRSPNVEAEIVSTVSGGDRVTAYDTVTDTQGNTWAYIEVGEAAGWVLGGVTPITTPPIPNREQGVVQTPVEVLAAPHPDASIMGSLPAGSPVTILTQRQDYAHIESGIVRGWIASCHLTASCN